MGRSNTNAWDGYLRVQAFDLCRHPSDRFAIFARNDPIEIFPPVRQGYAFRLEAVDPQPIFVSLGYHINSNLPIRWRVSLSSLEVFDGPPFMESLGSLVTLLCESCPRDQDQFVPKDLL